MFNSYFCLVQKAIAMSAYIYAIIPYKSGIAFSKEDEMYGYPESVLPELKKIKNEFSEPDGLMLFKEFLVVNTCYRQSAFTECKDGYNWIRSGCYEIATALGAKELWYVEELMTDEIESPGFNFGLWQKELQGKSYVVELTTEVLKGKRMFSVYHDDFHDIILERPAK